ncbi:hypothetical protein PLICRDRAFT_47242 [Plicaturopsis crispa FD-325 SS-3]|uniref:Inosine/uridine-preferring nucleoside hydrolase domain-containing protein n=1 Tax=Plicaturopsis crispa FD-325 SS-3 TaxID=944288 RepID=A0A0C9SQ56_PLICR|nr:hypothetical protein PLICRDRAFT_47242 [Plicaturopsis crispa FD-325 SS-3]
MFILYPLLAAATLAAAQPRAPTKPKLIIDTDIYSDCDDVAALALANLFHARGQIELLGVAVDTPSRYGAPAVSSINTYYGHPTIPIAARKPVTNATFTPDYPHLLATRYPGVVRDGEDTPDPVPLYRELLAGQDDGSVTIVSVGYFENIAGLLNSTADAVSPLAGRDLVAKKVKEIVIMGGKYPAGSEFNFDSDNPSLVQFITENWPTRMVFTGYEIGINILAGAVLTDYAPKDSPVRAAYIAYNGPNKNRYAWDPTAVIYASFGLDNLFVYGNHGGSVYVQNNGSDVWRDSPTKDQHYLAFPEREGANVTIANRLDEWLLEKVH